MNYRIGPETTEHKVHEGGVTPDPATPTGSQKARRWSMFHGW